jgi:20S proteasome subunit beta 7
VSYLISWSYGNYDTNLDDRQPIVTGTSVLAIKYKDGIMMAADNLGTRDILHTSYLMLTWKLLIASYGSLARFKDIQRLHPVGSHTVVGAGGDMSDFQHIQKDLDALLLEESNAQDGHTLGPAEIHEYLSQVMYARRSKMNPLWNSLLVGGVKGGKRYVFWEDNPAQSSEFWIKYRFLAYVDLLGTTYSASTLATGYGSYIAQPLLRKAVEGNEDVLTEDQAVEILEQSMRVLFYRDARSLNKVNFIYCLFVASGSEHLFSL